MYYTFGDKFYGWPREFAHGYPGGAHGRFVFSLIHGTVLEFDAACLAFNAAVAAVMVAGLGLAVEYRYRRWHRAAWQFTVNELLIAALVVAAALGSVIRQNIREEAGLKRLRCQFVAVSMLPDAIRRYLPNMPGGWLKPLDRVTSLHIVAGAREADDFMALDQFPEVKELVIEADFGDGALIHIARMPGLRQVSLESPRLTGENLAALAVLPRLRHLQIRSARLSDAGLRQLSQLGDVEIGLDFPGAAITAAQLRVLADAAGLVDLTLGDCRLDDDTLSALCQIKQLRRLTLDVTNQRSESLIRLARLRQLLSLTLHNLPPSGYRAIEDLRKNLPRCAIGVY